MTSTKRRAQRFSHVRAAHQVEMAEDYVEMIAELIEVQGEARAVDLAEQFGVSNATVNKTIARLQRDGLVVSRPYRSIFLTDEGEALAQQSRERHQIVLAFLLAIGVSREAAELDAEGLEHHVGEETLAAFARLTEENRRRADDPEGEAGPS
ncbi:MAG: manganese-binding transcriptional regulator MntR [Candidatus Competibacterales bacterium]